MMKQQQDRGTVTTFVHEPCRVCSFMRCDPRFVLAMIL